MISIPPIYIVFLRSLAAVCTHPQKTRDLRHPRHSKTNELTHLPLYNIHHFILKPTSPHTSLTQYLQLERERTPPSLLVFYTHARFFWLSFVAFVQKGVSLEKQGQTSGNSKTLRVQINYHVHTNNNWLHSLVLPPPQLLRMTGGKGVAHNSAPERRLSVIVHPK